APRSAQSAANRIEPELPHYADRLEEDLATHLALPGAAIDEHDRHLFDGQTALQRPVGELYLEGVAVRVNARDVDDLERSTREALVPGSEITHANPEDQAGIHRSSFADDVPPRSPALDAPTSDIARTGN